MTISNKITTVLLILIAFVFTWLIHEVVPEKQFVPYRLELDSVWNKETDKQDYCVDLNNDHRYETIRHHNINKTGHSLELMYNNSLRVIGIFGEKMFCISRYIKFADVDHDSVKEMMFVAASEHKVSLFILEFDFNVETNAPKPTIRQVDFDSVGYSNNMPDVINFDILTDKSDIYFDLQAGYSIQPRNIYKYNLLTKKIIKSSRNGIVNKKLELFSFNDSLYLLAKRVVVAANTFSQQQADKFRFSKNQDSVAIYDRIKNKIYQYGDFSSYTLLYNNQLDFAFKPIEFAGWTNYTLSEVLWKDSIPYILSLTNAHSADKATKKLTLCDLHGNIEKQVQLTNNYVGLYTNNKKMALIGNNTLDVYSLDFTLTKKIEGISFASGFYNLTGNLTKEFVAFNKNEMIVFSGDFSEKTSMVIAQEFAPYPEGNNIEILDKNGKTSLLFNTRLFYYLFSYEKNNIAFLKYPFYGIVFFFWIGLLLFLLKLNSKRLVHEKLQLETIINERTYELQRKNQELVLKSEEIKTQAEEIGEQYERLEKLDHFKESLTQALVHDLKNPLSQIMLRTSNTVVNQMAAKMLQLISNMLDVEKYEHAKFELNTRSHSLYKILEEVKNGQQISLNEKNIDFHLDFPDFQLLVDKDILIRIFDNLLSNAIRYSPLNRSIDIFAKPSGGDFIQITIRNYGEPIPEEALPVIFDKYRQFTKSDTSAYRTTGLGLTFCKMAVEAHGGEIGVSSKPEGVTDFWFTIPITIITGEDEGSGDTSRDVTTEIRFSASDLEIIKSVLAQVKECEVYEISRFHEVIDPLRETCGTAVNDWISLVFNAVYTQNTTELERLIKLTENE